jgi:hypothetical protein
LFRAFKTVVWEIDFFFVVGPTRAAKSRELSHMPSMVVGWLTAIL